jgi:ABC-type siderophore export system fused ATPase/permease subunit
MKTFCASASRAVLLPALLLVCFVGQVLLLPKKSSANDATRSIFSGEVIEVSGSLIKILVNKKSADQIITVTLSNTKITEDVPTEKSRSQGKRVRPVNATITQGDLVQIIGDSTGMNTVQADRVTINGSKAH